MRTIVFATLIFVVSTFSHAQSLLPYRNPALSTDERVADLMRRMTMEEKIGQLICPLGWPMYEKYGKDSIGVSDEFKGFVSDSKGGMLWATFRADPWTKKTLETGLNPELAAKTYNTLQRYNMEHSRLGIPLILAEEAPHGHMAIGTTVFPTGIGMASTWSRETMEAVGGVIAEELRAQGAYIGYGPVVDLAREPRWSRVEETFGEDVCLSSRLSGALLKGMSPLHRGYDKGIVSTLKHFVAYGVPQGGHNGNPSAVGGERDLYENFFPAFQNAVNEGALSVMTSYNSIDGVPGTSNEKYLRQLLKEKWSFQGFVVSDLESIDGLCFTHHIAKNRREAAETALKAGVDVDLGAHCYPYLIESVNEGYIDTALINDAVKRVLKIKFDFGLFENPYIDADHVGELVGSKRNTDIALKTALQSVTLLKNENHILPLSKNVNIALVGPNADNIYNQLGDYTAPQKPESIITPFKGIENKVGKGSVTYVKGCAVRDEVFNEIDKAVNAAKEADVVVAVVGGSSARDFDTKFLETGAAVTDGQSVSDMEAGEGFDRSSLDLLGCQMDLLKALKEAGKPLIVVYIEGRPLDKVWVNENSDALITVWYPGQQGGTALADVLFGDYNPAGRLPVSVPRSAGQLPVYYNKPQPRGHDYVEMSADPLFEFGYGLSYTTFEYSDLAIVPGPESVTVSFNIKNTGGYAGEEVPQIYVTDLVASTVRPQKQLRAFDRIAIRKGETIAMKFTLSKADFMLYDRNMEQVFEPGDFLIEVGASSKDIRLKETIQISQIR